MATTASIHTTNTDNEVVLASVTIANNTTCTFSALVQHLDGSNVETSDVSSVTYTITDMSESTPTAVTGHSNVQLTSTDVFSGATSVTYNREDVVCNFEFTPSRTSNEPFPTAGHLYKLRIDVVLTTPDEYISPLIFEITTAE